MKLFNLLKNICVKLNIISDFVIEQGKLGNWIYRKWNSGIAECWLVYEGAVNAYTATGPGTGLRYGRYVTFSYPFDFIETPSVTALSAQDNGFSYTFSTVAASGADNQFSVYWASNNDVDNSRVFLHVLGLWKEMI